MSIVGRDKNKIAVDIKPYRTKHFDDEFFERFTQALREYGQANPSYAGKAAAVTVVLPLSGRSTSMTRLNSRVPMSVLLPLHMSP